MVRQSSFLISAGLLGLLLLTGGCATSPEKPPAVAQPTTTATSQWQEEPVPDGPWRPHLLKRCRGVDFLSPAAEQALADCQDLWMEWEGSDAIMVLELYLQDHEAEGLLMLALAQLYVMAGQGVPQAMPREGPAADVGDWPQNQTRILNRAETLLKEAVTLRPDDSAVEFLLADVARASGDSLTARRAHLAGLHKCNLARSLEILRLFQGLNLYQAKGLEPAEPVYPDQAQQAGIQGEVLLDLLISPAGEVLQVEAVTSPAPSLTEAAGAALRRVKFAPARIGKYPIWSWYRVPVQFRLTEPESGQDSATGS